MLTPTSRLLELLEMLQAQPLTTGREIARRLEIDARTVRRYVAALQALDIPVEGQRGVGGGYRVRPGYRLPPLMLSDDEAVAVVLGLIGARGLSLERDAEPVDGALAKILRVLPSPLRTQVEALEQALGFTAAPSGAPVGGAVALALADAIRRRRRVRFAYRSFSGEPSRREVSPYGLVVHAGRWYLAAHDHGREDLRTFRVDRATGVAVARERGPSAGRRIRRGRPREPLARARALDVGGRGAAELLAGGGGRAPAAHARGARPGRRADAAPDARRLARLDGGRARRARLRLRDPRAGRARRERQALADRLSACA